MSDLEAAEDAEVEEIEMGMSEKQREAAMTEKEKRKEKDFFDSHAVLFPSGILSLHQL